MAPNIGDVVVSDVTGGGGYLIVEAITMRLLGGPYLLVADAAVKARQLCAGHVWRESFDALGRPLGAPFLLELQSSSLG